MRVSVDRGPWCAVSPRAGSSLASADSGLRYLKYDPLLRKLRGDPRYTALLRKMKPPLD
jgi:hypothetical protein